MPVRVLHVLLLPGAGDLVSTLGFEWWDTSCQHRSDRLLFVAPPRTQSPLPPPHGGTIAFSHG